MWPFGKKKDAAKNATSADRPGDTTVSPDSSANADATAASASPTTGEDTGGNGAVSTVTGTDGGVYDPVGGSFGPFDGDSVDYREFDFSDFAKGGLDLGSMLVPVPHTAEVQVEMGADGPRQIHILTPHGRITPAAFAAPRSGGQWEADIDEFAEGMTRDGLVVTRRRNDWGEELVGTVGEGVVRVIGVDGPRWMLRMTLAGPAASSDELAELSYEVISRTFVNRGSEPAPAGSALPVRIPTAMAEELRRAVQNRAAQPGQPTQTPRQTGPGNGQDGAAQPGTPARRRSGGTVGQQMGESE